MPLFRLTTFLLEVVINEGKKDRSISNHKLYYIAVTNKCVGGIARCLCPELNNPNDFLVSSSNDLRTFIDSSDCLTGIWFSPGDIKNVVEKMGILNFERKKNSHNELEYFLSTYQKNYSDFISVLSDEIDSASVLPYKKDSIEMSFYNNIKGLIFDIRR